MCSYLCLSSVLNGTKVQKQASSIGTLYSLAFCDCLFFAFPLSITTEGHLELFQDPPPAFMVTYPYDGLVIILNIHLFTPDLPGFIQGKVSENLAQICSSWTSLQEQYV